MKNILVLVVALAALSSCSTVPAGYRGIKVYLLGNRRGVETKQLGVGAYLLGPNQRLYTFPVFQQNHVWKDITFQSREGLDVNADFGVSYSLVPDSVSAIFQKYRRGIEEITDVFLRNMVRDALNTTASRMPIESIYGIHKKNLLDAVDSVVSIQTEKYGILIDRIYTIGEFHLPKSIEDAINSKLEANQKAQQTQNEVKAVEAEANKRIAKSKGDAESKIIEAKADAEKNVIEAKSSAERNVIQAQAEADAVKIRAQAEANANRIIADAQAEANRKLAATMSRELIQYRTIDKWDGKLPQISGQNTPFVNLSPLK